MKIIECAKCHWQHFAISQEKAETEVATFNQYFKTLSKEEQKMFYCGPEGSTITQYKHCHRCGHTQFQDLSHPEAYGSTMSPIIYPVDKE